MVIFAQKMGKTVVPVIEKFTELRMVIRLAEKLGVRPRFGVRWLVAPVPKSS